MTQRKSYQHRLGPFGTVMVVLFTIFTTVVAGWTATALISDCVNAVRLRNAVLVEARVLNFEVFDHGESGTAVYVTYSYEYQGVPYQHRTQQVAAFAIDNKLKNRLRDAMISGERVPCFIDPDRPELSVFSREFSVPLFLVSSLFPLVFGGFALILAISLVRHWREIYRRKT